VLTTDPLYYRPLLPVITIKNTANNSTLYTYNSFTDSGTTDKVLYCSVSLSQNTHGEFTVQFEDQNKSLESTVTVGSRVQIDCGKQSSSLTRLISGLVRKKGYARGANNKVLYTIQGSSTGIRLNERLAYAVSEAAKLPDGVTIDTSDASRKADTLLATNLSVLTSDGILSIANLATNSDVETFIASLSIEYGELQDLVNYIEDQSGGEVLVDTTDLVNFRYELKNNLTGRGFTLTNDNTNKANHDADDTMYLLNKNWNYEDDFYKSSAYANRLYAILPAQNKPGDRSELGYTISPATLDSAKVGTQIAVKFRPTHTRYFASDFLFVGGVWSTGPVDLHPPDQVVFICRDSGGSPLNTGGIVAAIVYNPEQFTDPAPTATDDNLYQIHAGDAIINTADGVIGQTYLDVTKDYWMIWDKTIGDPSQRLLLGKNSLATGANYRLNTGPNYATSTVGGTSWSALTAGTVAIGVGNYRSQSFVMWDPKGVQAVSSGLTAGQYVDSVLSDLGTQVTTKESMYRHLSNQLYVTPKPRTSFNFPSVSAPNIPPFPGDPIVISDTILDLSTAGSQIVLGTCGDMSYQWGNQGTGSYEAPTKLNLNVISVSPRYR
jgi:hypothetical protein